MNSKKFQPRPLTDAERSVGQAALQLVLAANVYAGAMDREHESLPDDLARVAVELRDASRPRQIASWADRHQRTAQINERIMTAAVAAAGIAGAAATVPAVRMLLDRISRDEPQHSSHPVLRAGLAAVGAAALGGLAVDAPNLRNENQARRRAASTLDSAIARALPRQIDSLDESAFPPAQAALLRVVGALNQVQTARDEHDEAWAELRDLPLLFDRSEQGLLSHEIVELIDEAYSVLDEIGALSPTELRQMLDEGLNRDFGAASGSLAAG